MSIHALIESELRKMGYTTPHAKAIIGIAKAAPSCAEARKWWTAETHLFSAANIAVLQENVRVLAAVYALSFAVEAGQTQRPALLV